MNGWMGTILRVNLHNRKITKEPLNEEVAYKYIGGRGLNTKILLDETKPGIDPLSLDNKLIFGTGPCNGTRVPGNSRVTLTAKSPMSDMYGTTNAGGPFGAEIKYAGYDSIIIEGQSDKPVYLWINGDKVEIRDAQHLWGKTTQEARKAIQREVGYANAAVIGIGPGGENLVRFASIISDLGRAFAKSGMGAVMGSKKLKAIAVRGTKGVKVAYPRQLEDIAREMLQDWKALEQMYQERLVYGLTNYQEIVNSLGVLPTRNFQEGIFPQGEPLYGQHMLEDYLLKQRKACFSCCAPCDKIHVVTKGTRKGVWGTAIEAGGQLYFGTLMGIDDLEVAVSASCLCDMYGIDWTEIGAVIPWAIECFQRGILTEEDTGGLRLEWGDGETMLKLLDMITYRQGFGDLLAEGVKKMSERVGQGSEAFAMHVKGSAIDYVDPRGMKGWGLGYAVSGRGAEHCMGELFSEYRICGWDPERGEVWDGQPVDPYTEENKAVMRKWVEEQNAFQNVMQICEIVYYYLPKIGIAAQEAKLYNTVTGLNLTDKDVMRIGERVINLEHAYNIREGWSRKDDTLPERFLKETLPEGPAKGQVVNLEPMLDEYYSLRGWNNSGLPTKAKLEELGLEEIASELERMGKLG